MRLKLVIAIAAGAISAIAAPAFAIDCGSPPPVADISLRGDIGAEAHIISKKLGTVSGNAAASYTRNEVYSRYPNADRASADRYFQYEICETVNADPKLTTLQRIRIIRDARTNFSETGITKSAALSLKPRVIAARLPTTRQSVPAKDPPLPAAPAINENKGPISGNQYNAQNMSFNATPDRKKYLPGLQNIYTRGSLLYNRLRSSSPTNEIVDQEAADANKWLADSQSWLIINMTQAAAVSLNNVKVGGLTYGVGTPLDAAHQNLFSQLMIQMPQYRDNVRYLMYSNTFDPQ